jgi:LPXTG-site transpeptidase (sortase) family protein
VLLFAAYELVGTNLSEEHSQSVLARQFATALATAPHPDGPSKATAVTASASGKTGGGTSTGDPSKGHAATGGNTATGEEVATGGKGALGRTTGKPAAGHDGQPVIGQSTSLISTKLVGASLPVPPPGGALDHLVIPAIGLSRYVVQGVNEGDLQMGPGHYLGTPLPGQPGNVGIAGHRTTFGAPFFRLNEVSRGDLVLLTDTSGTTWVYDVVRQWVVDPSDTAVLDTTRAPMLTLTTCNPRFEATSRLVVRAALLERVPRGAKVPTEAAAVAVGHRQPVSATVSATGPAQASTPTPAAEGAGAAQTSVPHPTGTAGAEKAGRAPVSAGSSSSGEGSPTVGTASASVAQVESGTGSGWAWVATIGFLVLALLGWVGTRIFAARLRRYSKFVVLAAGAIVCLVPLWFAFAHLVDLLPSNI